ncbi:DUF4167 domain-containing protein [Rhizobium rhizogenes]|uniref:DUF4167 domain-containing protein n=1 Tax=Rhizobium TaxID=379 RepID=UPI00026EE638|nr:MULTISPECIES: DUF4167 domain-containing protein [Rhizobium]EJK86245.1 hypothetical protein PMI03_01806 [Rhizobium sp. AP16]NTF88605.1 DUF4167 domain-containing protein [Rhizobium rhizogenes]NTG47107.1 DUF4167 domain-containing protein [Rhizobium rhizogenes]
MRPGQQNKRGRGRGNNNGGGGGNNNNNNNFNRKGSNPLTRTYDSSGPDVKIRGTAQHIAEKYATLARDAQSSGDRVMAENYLQHAEHYNRIIASAQAQMQERFQRDEQHNPNDRDNADRDMDDMDANDNDMDDQPQMAPAPAPVRVRAPAPAVVAAPEPEVIDGTGPQPVIEGIPAEVAIEEETPVAAGERQPRRRNAGNRPRRQPRRNADAEGQGEGEAAPSEAPALVEAATE